MTLGSLKHTALQLSSATDFTWRWFRNFRSASQYRVSHPALCTTAARVTSDLARDGIAMVPAGELFGDNPLYEELSRAVARRERDSAARLGDLRRAYQSGEAGAQKPFAIVLEGENAPAPGVYTAFALQRRLLDVANAYFGAFSVLTHCQIWHNFVAAGAPSQSQLWHRDPEDRHILKLFLYLTHVDDGAGPLTYALGSHRHPDQVAPHARLDGQTARSTDEEMAKLIPPDRWVTACGGRGTVVFADTRGYHKGGWGTRSERIVYVCQFLCGASQGISTRDYHLGRLAPPPVRAESEAAPATIRAGAA